MKKILTIILILTFSISNLCYAKKSPEHWKQRESQIYLRYFWKDNVPDCKRRVYFMLGWEMYLEKEQFNIQPGWQGYDKDGHVRIQYFDKQGNEVILDPTLPNHDKQYFIEYPEGKLYIHQGAKWNNTIFKRNRKSLRETGYIRGVPYYEDYMKRKKK